VKQWDGWYAQVFERVPVQPRDAREASDVFYKQGTGDVLLNYENEVYFTNKMYEAKDRLPYIVPDRNVRVRIHAQCQEPCKWTESQRCIPRPD
jgi:ABC-type sulfate transport system substrate-binding protein